MRKINLKVAGVILAGVAIMALFVIAIIAETQKKASDSTTKNEDEKVRVVNDPISGEQVVENSPGKPEREEHDVTLKSPTVLGMYNLVEMGLSSDNAETIDYNLRKRARKLDLDKDKLISIAKDSIKISQGRQTINTVYTFDVYYDSKLWIQYAITMEGISDGKHSLDEKKL